MYLKINWPSVLNFFDLLSGSESEDERSPAIEVSTIADLFLFLLLLNFFLSPWLIEEGCTIFFNILCSFVRLLSSNVCRSFSWNNNKKNHKLGKIYLFYQNKLWSIVIDSISLHRTWVHPTVPVLLRYQKKKK